MSYSNQYKIDHDIYYLNDRLNVIESIRKINTSNIKLYANHLVEFYFDHGEILNLQLINDIQVSN